MVMKMSTITWRLRAGRMARRSNRAPTRATATMARGKARAMGRPAPMSKL